MGNKIYRHLVPVEAFEQMLVGEISRFDCADLTVDSHLAAGKPLPSYQSVVLYLGDLERDFLVYAMAKR